MLSKGETPYCLCVRQLLRHDRVGHIHSVQPNIGERQGEEQHLLRVSDIKSPVLPILNYGVIALHERSDDPFRFRSRLGQPGKEPADIVEQCPISASDMKVVAPHMNAWNHDYTI